MLDTVIHYVAYFGFFFTISFLVGTIAQTIIQLVLAYAQTVGRDEDISWDFTSVGRNLMLWLGLSAFLWHYNFGG